MCNCNGSQLATADAGDLISFADAWINLGTAIQDQVKQVLAQGPEYEANANAIRHATDVLQGFNEDIDAALAEWLDTNG